MREDMIGCLCEVEREGRGQLVAWAPPLAVVALDGGSVQMVSFYHLRLIPDAAPESEQLRAEVANLRARNVELSAQLAQHASDRPRWPKWEELPEEDRGAAKDLLGEALGPCNWFEVGRYKTPVGYAYPDHDAVLDRTEDSAPELQRILTEFLRGLAEWETGR